MTYSKKGRSLKLREHIRSVFLSENFPDSSDFSGLSPRLVLASLFSFYFSSDEILKWRAVSATGRIVGKMAEDNLESARIIMRRLMWTLNDESGGIGWGSPEAMAEIMAGNRRLAEEYSRILVSYIMEDGNYLEHEMLQRGVLWAVCRLAEAWPDLVSGAKGHIRQYSFSDDREIRGLSALAAGRCRDMEMLDRLEILKNENESMNFYESGRIKQMLISETASDALKILKMQWR